MVRPWFAYYFDTVSFVCILSRQMEGPRYVTSADVLSQALSYIKKDCFNYYRLG